MHYLKPLSGIIPTTCVYVRIEHDKICHNTAEFVLEVHVGGSLTCGLIAAAVTEAKELYDQLLADGSKNIVVTTVVYGVEGIAPETYRS